MQEKEETQNLETSKEMLIRIAENATDTGIYNFATDEDWLTVIEENETNITNLQQTVKDEKEVLVTKVEYPADVVDCALELLEWSVKFGGKVGIKSETLSRHSVTYEDSATLFMGYPVGILNGLSLHMKARF